MDQPSCPKRLCFTYVITFVFLVFFFYHLMANNRRSVMELTRLKEDVNCISQMLKETCVARKQKCGAIGTPKFLPSECESAHLNACIEALFKRKLGNLLDDVYDIKNQVNSVKCEKKEALMKLEKNALIPTSTRINYASDEMGARITKVIAIPIVRSNIFMSLLGFDFSTNPPINMLRPSLTPGSCFGFRGCKATVYLNLALIIRVDEISLTHVAPEKTPSRCVKTAPKNFEVYGIAPDNPKEVYLGCWEYKNDPTKRTQIYEVKNENFFKTLVFVFLSNHGANTTCIYSVEVYGDIK